MLRDASHCDRPYATEVEGYLGLVVHGPLQAIALAELVRRHDGRSLTEFRFTAQAPAFDQGPLRLRGRPADDGSAELHGYDHAGTLVMKAAAVPNMP